MRARHAIRRTFIDPLRDWRRCAVLFGTLAGFFGFALVNVASAYDLGGENLRTLLAYYGPAMLLPGFILWPLIYLGFRTVDGEGWRAFILLAQALVFMAFLALPKDPLERGVAAGFLMAPYWGAYHIAMVHNTTSHNRAFEVALAMFLGVAGSIGGVIAAGVLLDRGLDTAAIALAFAGLLAGSIAVLAATRYRPNTTPRAFVAEAFKVIHDNPYLVRRIITQSLYDMPGFTLAAFLHILHFSAATAAALLASRIVAEFVLAPIVGHFVHTRRNRGFGLGMVFIGAAWLFLLLSPRNSAALVVFMIAYGTGARFAFNSLISGLYEMQSYASMMWTEVFLGVGRLLGMIFLMPLLYWNANLYMLELALLAGVLFIFNRIWMRKWRIG